MCMRREELEYSTNDEIAVNDIYVAPPINRCRDNYKILHMFNTSWSLEQKIRSVYSFTRRKGNRRSLLSFSKLTPQMLADCYTVVAEHKSIGAVQRDKANVPAAVRRALDTMQVATQDCLNTDGHRRLLRHEGQAYSARYGPSAIFTTPNFPQQRHATFLLTRGEAEDAEFSLEVEHPDLGLLGDMMKKQAGDPVGLALADDLVFRLFQLHVFGVREDCVGARRGRARERAEEAVWDNSAAASTRLGIVGPPQAGHGPLESSGRFALHGHWRWWLRSFSYQRMVELCKQEPELLESRLREATSEAIRSILSVQESSVAQISRAFGDLGHPFEPLPLLHWQNVDFGGDGGFEKTTKGKTSSLQRPKLDSVPRYPTEGLQPEVATLHPYKKPLQGTVISSLPAYRRLGSVAETSAGLQLVRVVSSDEWRKLFSNDAWELVMRCILHACGLSCWKYSKPGLPPTCRHGCFHVIVFTEYDVKGRRSGKLLRNVIKIVSDDEGGMLGRILNFQEHPYEGPTNYTGLVCLRCNLDLQDLRRVLLMYAPEQLPCVGDRPDWAWMNEGGVPWHLPQAIFPNEDVLLRLATLEQRNHGHATVLTDADKELSKLLLLMFVDTHNTGFYVNSYTTKMGVGMAEFMQHLTKGIERLQDQLAADEAKLAAEAKALGRGPKSLGLARRAAKTLLRINTSYTKCKHVGGSELVFPMLFGHLCYQTHKCWNVWTKTAVWRALESWRRSIGSIHAIAPEEVDEPEQMVHADRGSLNFLPKDWLRVDGSKVRGPDGTLYASVRLAQEAYLASQSMDRHVPTEDLTTLVNFLHSAEDEAEELLEVDGVVVTTNQLDDYNHRGDHPLLAPMTLYVYSMWVHRVETVQAHGEQRSVRVPFHSSYKLAVGYTQQITVTERVPKIDGYMMPPPRSRGAGTVSDQELNAMFKSVLHRPTRLAAPAVNGSKQIYWYQKVIVFPHPV